MTESTAVVNYQEQLRRELAQLSETVEAPSSNKISTKGKTFTLPNQRSSPGPLQVIVLDYIAVNMVYKGAYNPSIKQPPLCWAIGREIKNLAPSKNVPTPQAVDCASCPKNQWGSGAGGRGRACKNQRRLLVIAPDLKGEPMTLYVSPTGLKAWDSYVRDLAHDHGKLPIQVITSVTFDPQQSYPSLQFSFVDYHGNVEDAIRLRAKYQEIVTREPELKEERDAA